MSLDELKTRRAAYLAAEIAILTGQEYEIADGVTQRRLRRADLAEVRQAIAELDSAIAAASLPACARRVLYIR